MVLGNFFAHCLLQKGSQKVLFSTFAAVCDEYLEKWVKIHNKDIRGKQRFLNDFKSRWGTLPISALGISHADKYAASRNDEVKPASINRGLACLCHLMAWSKKRGYLKENPLDEYEKLKEEPCPRQEATSEIIKAIFAKLPPIFVPVFTLIWQTAARRGEILSLTHVQVNREKRQITFFITKGKKARIVPISDLAMEALDAIAPLAGCRYVFYNPETKNRWRDCRKPWENARKEAGYPWVTVKHLRPAMATQLSTLGLDAQDIKELLGHSSMAVTEKFYTKRKPDEACHKALQVLKKAS